ncbi:MAG TPA: hypothetical protein VF790_01945 [Dissulfurispiraceae bacterium]
MRRIAFFDLKDRPALYILEGNGSGYALKETVEVSVEGVHGYRPERAIEHIDEAYLSLPLEMLNFRVVELPFSDPERVREVLPLELDSLILGGAGNAIFDGHILGESDGKYRVLAVYAMKDALGAILAGLRPHGIDPKVVTSLETASCLETFASGEEIARLVLEQRHKRLSAEERIRRAVKEVQGPVVNLRRGGLAYKGDAEKTKKVLRVSAVLALLLTLVFFADMSLRIISSKRESAAVREEIKRSYSDVFPGEKNVTGELYRLKAHFKEMKDKETAFAGAEPLQVLLVLSGVGGQGVSFSEISVDRDRIVMKGECQSLSDVQKLKGSLDRVLSGVSIADTKTSAQNKTLFTITAAGRKA